MDSLRLAYIESQLIAADTIETDFKGLYPRPFLSMMRYVIKSEGGLAPGGHTLFGLDARAHPDLADEIRRGSLTINQTLARYYRDYYSNLPGLDDLHPGLRYFVFDSRIQGSVFLVTSFLLPALGLRGKFSGITEGLVRLLKYVPADSAMNALRRLAANPKPMADRLHENVNRNARRMGRGSFPYAGSLRRVQDRLYHSIKFGERGV